MQGHNTGSVPSKDFELEPILLNLTKLEGFLHQNR